MIDTHCHIDLHNDPVVLAEEIQSSQTGCVAVTMLPSHYQLGLEHLARFTNIHASLGLHPLRAEEGKCQTEAFIELSRSCDYIGEVGLDFSREGISTKRLQLDILSQIINSLKGSKFVSVHSRGAAIELLQVLEDNKVGPVCFHYFTAGPLVAETLIEAGHYLSFNRRMLSGKHKELLRVVPKERVLIESDGPFLTTSPINATRDVYTKVAEYWRVSFSEAVETIQNNFTKCRTQS